MITLLTSIVLLGGAMLILTAAIGLVRLPDVLCRAHAVSKGVTLGMFLLLLSVWLHLGEKVVGLKIILAIFFQAVTIPISSHLVALWARRRRVPRWHERPVARLPRREEPGLGSAEKDG